MIDNDITESFNLATEENISINDITVLALKATNSKHLEIRYDPTKPNGQYRKDVSILKFKSLIPNYNFITLEEGISKYYETYKLK